MILGIMRKDWLLLWPMVLLVLGIQIALQWVVFKAGLFGDSLAALELLRPLMLAWLLGMTALTVAAVHQDPLPGVDQDWLVRPVKRGDLAAAKLLFVLLTVCLPLFVLDLLHTAAMGFPLLTAMPPLAAKELYLFAFLLLPVMALASTTRSVPELALLGAALIVVYAVGTGAAALLLGDRRCPTCDSGFAWVDHVAQHLLVAAGAACILLLQFRRRLTTVSRALVLLGAAALGFAHLPWNAAAALHARLSPFPGSAAAVRLEPIGVETPAAGEPAAEPRAGPPRRAAQALLNGDVDQAVELMRRRGRHGGRENAVLDVPIRVSGVGAREMLLVDRAEVSLVRPDGRVIHREVIPDEPSTALRPAGDDPEVAHQLVRVPAGLLARGAGPPVSLRLGYSMTLVRLVAEHDLRADDGTLRASETGFCASRLDPDSVTLRCKQVGRPPFCYSATLVGADGSRNPEVLKCQPDYRPYGATFSALSFLGADLMVHDRYGLAHYPVDRAKAVDATVILKVYEVREHLRRDVSVANPAAAAARPPPGV